MAEAKKEKHPLWVVYTVDTFSRKYDIQSRHFKTFQKHFSKQTAVKKV